MMTRKNYLSAARIVAMMREQGNPGWIAAADAFAQFFGDDNRAFDVRRFDEACGRFAGVTCAVDDCSTPALPKKGLCATHAEPVAPAVVRCLSCGATHGHFPGCVTRALETAAKGKKPARFVGVVRSRAGGR